MATNATMLRQLRQRRVLSSLRVVTGHDGVSSERDALLSTLLLLSDERGGSLDTLSDENVELAVSIALAELAEPELDRVRVLLLAGLVLAYDGQFGRLRQLAPRVKTVARRLEVDRPFLSTFLDSLVDLIRDDQDRAVGRLESHLGLDLNQPSPIDQRVRSFDHVSDLVAAAVLHRQLLDDPWTTGRELALVRGDGLLLLEIDLVGAVSSAKASCEVRSVVEQQLGSDLSSPMPEYLERNRIKTFLPAQREAVRRGVLKTATRVIAMPTSSGKTFLAELRIAAELSGSDGGRAVYLAPYRVLARQVEQHLSQGLRPLGLRVRDLGSGFDSSLDDLVREAGVGAPTAVLSGDAAGEFEAGELPDVIVATPERFDGLLRLAHSDRSGSGQARELLDGLRVLIVDEVQILGRSGRGPRIELLITRFHQAHPDVPILALSAVAEGVEALGAWLGGEEPIVTGRRPTGTIEVLWETDGDLRLRSASGSAKIGSIPRGAKAIEDAASLILRLPAELFPVLAIETTRPLAESLAGKVAAMSPEEGRRWREGLTEESRRRLDLTVEEARALLGPNHPLGEMLRDGVAYHHAGVPPHLLRQLEQLASSQRLRMMAATTTVAEGADLPFKVVVIPHLNFDTPTRRLDRELYTNIIGRAGRVSSSIEGLVFVLDSDAATLKNHVRSRLWTAEQALPLRGGLSTISPDSGIASIHAGYRELQSQVLAWLGEGGDAEDHQAERLASSTFSWSTSSSVQQTRILATLQTALSDMESQDLIRAASPFKLTATGARARLAGLGPRSCTRLLRALSERQYAALALVGVQRITTVMSTELARLMFEAEELLEQSLWLRRLASDPQVRLGAQRATMLGTRPWPEEDPLFEVDVDFLAKWVLGATYEELADLVPVFKRGLFSGSNASDRASDAAEQVGRLAYPASWCWSAIRALLGDQGDSLPFWMRDAIELGVPTETATRVILDFGVSRTGAMQLGEVLPPSWEQAVEVLFFEVDESALRDLGMTGRDMERLARGR